MIDFKTKGALLWQGKTGRHQHIPFATTGYKAVRVSSTNAFGEGFDEKVVELDEWDGKPYVRIEQPNFEFLTPRAPMALDKLNRLKATAIPLTTTFTYTWSFNAVSLPSPIEIGQGPDTTWTPPPGLFSYDPQTCPLFDGFIVVTARDASGNEVQPDGIPVVLSKLECFPQ